MACVLQQLMSQPSMTSLVVLPHFARAPWWSEVTEELYTKNKAQWNDETHFTVSTQEKLYIYNLDEENIATDPVVWPVSFKFFAKPPSVTVTQPLQIL